MFMVLTNNPRAKKWWKESESNHAHVLFQDSDLSELYIAARNLVHTGWRLVNHPLSSSIKPNQSPYKTLVLAKHSHLDYQSLCAMEAAIAAVQKFGPFPGASDKVLEDLQLIDLDLCKDIYLH